MIVVTCPTCDAVVPDEGRPRRCPKCDVIPNRKGGGDVLKSDQGGAANLCDVLREVRAELGRLKAEQQLVADGQGHRLKGDERDRARRVVAAVERAQGELAAAVDAAASAAAALAGHWPGVAGSVLGAMVDGVVTAEVLAQRHGAGRYNGSPLPDPCAERAG